MTTFLIDDDSLSNYLTETLLKMEDFSSDIRTFEAADEALAELVQQPEQARVVFLDLNMPLMNGWEFLDALAPYRSRLLGHCRIYILTSSLALSDLNRSHDYELVAGLIHKPIDSGEIRAIQASLAQTSAE
ncbi:response regulator [Hymenobacter yonginensis]|uniref:Response regulator n=1 Tax=Hymenobacter yonginensis TaxID=748197 RepID=A0ABY7PRQ5_9BACT|nr:response regulator [Hymenobacter yonginensis]WBO85523.1 response regulator [Hymenobacter yonginensis]